MPYLCDSTCSGLWECMLLHSQRNSAQPFLKDQLSVLKQNFTDQMQHKQMQLEKFESETGVIISRTFFFQQAKLSEEWMGGDRGIWPQENRKSKTHCESIGSKWHIDW